MRAHSASSRSAGGSERARRSTLDKNSANAACGPTSGRSKPGAKLRTRLRNATHSVSSSGPGLPSGAEIEGSHDLLISPVGGLGEIGGADQNPNEVFPNQQGHLCMQYAAARQGDGQHVPAKAAVGSSVPGSTSTQAKDCASFSSRSIR